MLFFSLAFFMGDLYLQTFSALPSNRFICYALLAGCIFYLLCRKHWSLSYLPLAMIMGWAFSAWYAHSLLSWSLPTDWEGRELLATGSIASLPLQEQEQIHFLFSLDQLTYKQAAITKPALIKLSLSQPYHLALRAGDKYQFVVRLKRIHGTQNPGGFDFEAWALQKGLRASGYVVASDANRLLSHQWYHYPIQRLRQIIQKKIKMHLPHTPTSFWLMALVIGEREGIAQSDWQILRNTGTNHLMAIAGLHIGIVAGLVHAIVSWCWRRLPVFSLRFPASQAGASAALLAAIAYSALAGFSLPTQRACIMLSVLILALLSRRKISGWHAWSLALLLVLILNPLSVVTESFWLSFGTLAFIFYGMSGRLSPRGLWWKWGRVQWVIGWGLIPISLVLFQQCSLISFIANSIAIPWLGFFILPICLLGSLCLLISPSLGHFFLFLADKSLAGLWFFLTQLSQWPFSTWQVAIPNTLILLLTVAGFLLLLLPSGFPLRILGCLWLLPLVTFQPAKPDTGDFWLTLLDVGQGLSVIVQTKNHLLVYDAGPKYQTSFDMGESVVLPYLYQLRTKHIDGLVISHGDNDHSGGTQALFNALPMKWIKTSVPEKLFTGIAKPCLAEESWQWDQVTFSFLYPYADHLHLGNDSSCVLRIDNGKHSLLLTGDIEKTAEKTLLDRSYTALRSTILIAPHHGSKTSGLETFIAAVHPQIVLYATGYRNRYHFPHAQVVAAYKKISAQQLNTAETGAIHFRLNQRETDLQAETYREIHKRYWYAG